MPFYNVDFKSETLKNVIWFEIVKIYLIIMYIGHYETYGLFNDIIVIVKKFVTYVSVREFTCYLDCKKNKYILFALNGINISWDGKII